MEFNKDCNMCKPTFIRDTLVIGDKQVGDDEFFRLCLNKNGVVIYIHLAWTCFAPVHLVKISRSGIKVDLQYWWNHSLPIWAPCIHCIMLSIWNKSNSPIRKERLIFSVHNSRLHQTDLFWWWHWLSVDRHQCPWASFCSLSSFSDPAGRYAGHQRWWNHSPGYS